MTSSDFPAAALTPSPGSGGRPLSPDDFVVLNDEIRAFVRAGIPLDIGLHGTAGRTSGLLGKLSRRLAERLEIGASLEDALAAEGDTLPTAYRAILEAGLRSGRLDDVLASLSELAESTSSLRRQLQLSAIYPMTVVALALALFGLFTAYILPQIQRTYEVFDLEQSWLVDGLFWLHQARWLSGYSVGILAVGLLFVGILALVRILSGVGLSRWIPGSRELSLSRFARVLSLLVEHQVPLPEACRLSGEAAGDSHLSHAASELATTVERGQSLQQAMEGSQRLPSLLRWLITVGERQGSLAPSLKQAAAVYEQRAITKMEWFRRIVPPVTVVVCCGTITLLYGLTLFVPLAEMLKQLGVG